MMLHSFRRVAMSPFFHRASRSSSFFRCSFALLFFDGFCSRSDGRVWYTLRAIGANSVFLLKCSNHVVNSLTNSFAAFPVGNFIIFRRHFMIVLYASLICCTNSKPFRLFMGFDGSGFTGTNSGMSGVWDAAGCWGNGGASGGGLGGCTPGFGGCFFTHAALWIPFPRCVGKVWWHISQLYDMIPVFDD